MKRSPFAEPWCPINGLVRSIAIVASVVEDNPFSNGCQSALTCDGSSCAWWVSVAPSPDQPDAAPMGRCAIARDSTPFVDPMMDEDPACDDE